MLPRFVVVDRIVQWLRQVSGVCGWIVDQLSAIIVSYQRTYRWPAPQLTKIHCHLYSAFVLLRVRSCYVCHEKLGDKSISQLCDTLYCKYM